jgi:transglutaminase-like putative cysteine protease
MLLRFLRLARVAFLLAALLTAARAASPHPSLRVAPPPDWLLAPLDPLAAAAVPVEEEQSAGIDYLLSERQVRSAPQSAYVHFAYRVTAPTGLSEAAEFSVEFDPAHETVDLHHLRVLRDGREQDRLELEAFEILREERDRDRALYDGRLTALLHLRDVRVGDIVHYAYTVHGANPVFGGRYVDRLYLGWAKPLRQLRYRVVQPPGAPAALRHRVLGPGEWSADEATLPDGAREWIWQREPLAGLLVDSDYPSWFQAYPLLQLAQFYDWAAVVEWALPLYQHDASSPGILERVEQLRAAAGDAEGRVLAALDLVQNEVRYLGIELGPGSHRPTPPALTLERRFGDCKDKTLLLCSLLRGLGLEADPALVHSAHGRSLASPLAAQAANPGLHAHLPSPLAFDHVIARVRLPDGQEFWLDPTREHQVGPLAERTAHDFGQALVLRVGETGLVDMRRPSGASGGLREQLVFTSHGLESPADLEVTTIYEGDRATGMRAYLAGTKPTQLGRDYLNYYISRYPGTTAARELNWTDDRERNRIEVREAYTVPDFWTRDEDQIWRAELYPYTIGELVRAPAAQERRAPLALGVPEDTRVEIRLRLHEDWNVTPVSHEVASPRLRYESSVRLLERELVLNYHLRSLEDQVPAAEVAAHAARLSEIRDDLNFQLTKNEKLAAAEGDASYRVNRGMIALALLTFTAAIVVFWRVWRRPLVPGSPPPLPPAPSPAIGGWLILFALSLIARCLLLPKTFAGQFPTYFSLGIWETLTTDREAANLPLAALIAVELVGNLTLVLLTWFAALLFFLRRREAPRWNVVALVFGAVLVLVDGLVAGQVVEPAPEFDLGQVTRAWVGVLIWVPYLLRSDRVRETFVR